MKKYIVSISLSFALLCIPATHGAQQQDPASEEVHALSAPEESSEPSTPDITPTAEPLSQADTLWNMAIARDDTKDPIWKNAKSGIREFRAKYKPILGNLAAKDQNPDMIVIGCIDSRASADKIFQARPGKILGIRNIANIVPTFNPDGGTHGVSAALEYGITALNIKNIVILAHSHCGGIKGLLTGVGPNDFISPWIAQIDTILPANYKTNSKVSEQTVNEYARKGAIQSARNLLTFPFIVERIKNNNLKIHVLYFDIPTGTVYHYSPNNDQSSLNGFKPLKINMQSPKNRKPQAKQNQSKTGSRPFLKSNTNKYAKTAPKGQTRSAYPAKKGISRTPKRTLQVPVPENSTESAE